MDYSILDDSDLFMVISELGKGDASGMKLDDAIGELYDRFGRLVYSIALRIVKDQATAEEITQDVFMRAYQRADSYKAEISGAGSWMAGITRHRAIDELRRRKVRPENNSIDWPEDIGADFMPGMPAMHDPVKSVEEYLEARAIRELIQSLPREQRRAISLAYFGAYSQVEIAALLDEPLGTIKSRIRLGMQRL
ncbi:MAG: RNA polymerase sigma factor, partial [Anaerolineaceae bacterium]